MIHNRTGPYMKFWAYPQTHSSFCRVSSLFCLPCTDPLQKWQHLHSSGIPAIIPTPITTLLCTALGAKFILTQRNSLKPLFNTSDKESLGGTYTTHIACTDISTWSDIPPHYSLSKNINIIFKVWGIFVHSDAFFRSQVAWVTTVNGTYSFQIHNIERDVFSLSELVIKYRYSSSHTRVFSHVYVIKADSVRSDLSFRLSLWKIWKNLSWVQQKRTIGNQFLTLLPVMKVP